MRAKAKAVIVLAALLALPAASRADEAEEPGKLAAVQKRKFRMDHEVFAAAQLLPLDAFYKGLGPSGGYTLHFSDVVAWEVLRGGYAFRLHTGLRDQLEQDFNVAPTAFEELMWMVDTGLMLTPWYGKFAFANSRVTHAEIFLFLGGTMAKFEDSYKPGPQVGAGLRFFLSEWVSLRFDCRYHYLIATKSSTQLLDLGLGLAFNLGGTD